MLALAEEVIRLEDNSHQAQEMEMEMYYVKGRYKIAVGEYNTGISCIVKKYGTGREPGRKENAAE